MVPFFKLALTTLDEGRQAAHQVTDDLTELEYKDNTVPQLSQTILEEIRQKLPTDAEAQEANGPDYKWVSSLLYYQGNRFFIPNDQELRFRILRNFHDSPTAGHHGRDRTITSIRRWFYWPQMANHITKYVKTCNACQRSKQAKHHPYGELTPIPVPNVP